MLAFSRVRDLLGGARVVRALPPMDRIVALSFVITVSAGLLLILVRTVVAEAENREHALAEAAALAQAHALQSQINPHFLLPELLEEDAKGRAVAVG